MFGSESEEKLRRLFEAPRGARPENARELEGQLLAAFDQLYPKKERIRMKSPMFRRAMLLCAAAGVLGAVACTAPVDLDIEVGKSVSIHYSAEGAGRPEPEEVISFLQTAIGGADKARAPASGKPEPQHRQVNGRVQREADEVSIDVEVWGSGLSGEPLAGRIKEAFPALADAKIDEELLHGKVRGTLAKKLGHDLLSLNVIDVTDEESARQQVMDQLRAQGLRGKVDVRIEGGEGERKVMIRVESDCPDASAGGAQEAE